MGLNIMFWNCQGIRPKRKELELYSTENSIDIIALNETLLNKKYTFKVPGYDTIQKDCSTGIRGGESPFSLKAPFLTQQSLQDINFP